VISLGKQRGAEKTPKSDGTTESIYLSVALIYLVEVV
jgi:hypothetical protein